MLQELLASESQATGCNPSQQVKMGRTVLERNATDNLTFDLKGQINSEVPGLQKSKESIYRRCT